MRVIWDIFIGDVRSLFRNVIAAIVVMGLALVPPMYAWFLPCLLRSDSSHCPRIIHWLRRLTLLWAVKQRCILCRCHVRFQHRLRSQNGLFLCTYLLIDHLCRNF